MSRRDFEQLQRQQRLIERTKAATERTREATAEVLDYIADLVAEKVVQQLRAELRALTPAPIEETPDEWLAPRDAAKLLGVTVQTLAVWRSSKRYPLPYSKSGARVRYLRADCEAFLRRK